MADEGRELIPKIVTRFRGISQYRNVAGVGLDYALDLNNVIVSGAGYLEKLRVPTARSAIVQVGGKNQGIIDRLYDFQQANGTRQLIASFLQGLGYYVEPAVGANFNFTQIEADLADQPRFSFVDANNLLFGANGLKNFKWTGAAKQNWGIVAPIAAPTIGAKVPIKSIQRAANVITVTMDTSAISPNTINGFNPLQLKTIPVGDTITVDSVAADVPANGSFSVTVSGPLDFQFSYASVGPNFGPVVQGNVTIYTTPCKNTGASTDFNITQIQVAAGVVTVFFKNNYRILPGEEFVLAGFTGAYTNYNGTFRATAATAVSVSFGQLGSDVGITVPTGPGKITGGFTDQVGPRTWWYSYGNSILGNESALSPQSVTIPNSTLGLVTNVRAYLTAVASPDAQVDVIFWYAALDGAGDPYLLNGPLNTNTLFGGSPVANGYMFGDGFNDDLIDITQPGSFINFPPPVCRALSKWQNRIYFVPMNDQQTLGYTGYEQILRGRPEENVPPGNYIRLNIGANIIKGHGALMNGVVIWDSSDRMFMFKGTVEDISTLQPVGYSEQLEEMPWQIGVYSHESIQPTPYGLVWFGSDKTFHKWNGIFYGEIIGPQDIGQNIYPLLRRITKGTESIIQTAYFNFLERDWYVALIAVDGSATPNMILFFDMAKDESDNLGVWVSSIQADSICAQTDGNGQRHLLIASKGIIYEIKADGGSTGGLHKNMTETNAVLDAYWKSGYEGNDDPLMMKMYRFGRLVTDQTGFKLLVTLVDDDTSSLIAPVTTKELVPIFPGGKFTVNWKARRCGVEIRFPKEDIDASVLQLMLAHIPLSAR